ncbi:HAD family hydrolase [Mangrovihabitans endophyticus]|uniref:Haloacid dehalogenase superfamily, subfamily IA, variant 3 with third motif having DD or ED n=1 Tax=Mangrovihabitans endophyticus TaxID=1751298 RepID=A0A8J3FTS0_9ACTN|nr:HAD family phosphatase [Mangrovihabitans endophyticus]GGL21431.1 hypothetical protein GCM10012284_65050 [Mangrovihabitans endophyticus]
MNATIVPPDGTGFDALIFDWDGTLVDSTEVCFRALSDSLADSGVFLDPDWYWPRQAIASPDLLRSWEQEFGTLPESIDKIIHRCRRYVIEAAPLLQVIEPIASIARLANGRGQEVAIGSNASSDVVVAGLQATGLDAVVDKVATWSDVATGRGKPAPDIFLLAAQMMGADRGRCLVYEDSEAGINAALQAGMTVCDVASGVVRQPAEAR